MGFISLEAYILSVHAQQSEVFLVLLYMYCTEIFFFSFYIILKHFKKMIEELSLNQARQLFTCICP